MPRVLRVALVGLEPGEIELDAAQARYVARVHRLGPGDCFVAFDPERRLEADARIVRRDKRAVRCELSEPRPATALPPASVTLIQALGKGDKADRVVRDATALGVSRLVFVTSERTVVALSDRASDRRRRWRTIAVEAARQSGRGDLPEILGPLDVRDALDRCGPEPCCRLILDPRAIQRLAEALAPVAPAGAVALAIGPEGGWSAEERAAFEAAGYQPVTLGRFVLRTETAAAAALGAVVSRWP